MPSPKPNLLLIGGGALAVYLIGRKLGLWGKERTEDSSCVGPYTLSTFDARMICDAIEAAATGLTEDEGKIANLLQRAQTNGDVCRLHVTYGSRQIGAMGVPFTLVELVTTYLNEPVFIGGSRTWIDEINDNWASKGIEMRY